ncbi:hypothetical protein RRSWK_01535 [Rhodopirellula sp. SWK7]|nr:hypothetical protein RRSWK_01535 [Rhodopirellula sp. SWK7]
MGKTKLSFSENSNSFQLKTGEKRSEGGNNDPQLRFKWELDGRQ